MTQLTDCHGHLIPGRPDDADVELVAMGASRLQVSEGVVVSFECGSTWIVDFECGIGSLTVVESVGSDSFLVIAHGAIYLVNARRRTHERAGGIAMSYGRVDRNLVVCATQTDVVVCGPTGVVWRTRVSSDGVTLTRITADEIECDGWDAATDTASHYHLSMSDGRLLSRTAFEPKIGGP